MRIDANFIETVLGQFYKSFCTEKDWCVVSGVNPNIDVYGKHIYQKLYALKYLPAYYFEYCILADKLKNRLEKNAQKMVSIASLGCGLTPCYYALSHNLGGIGFDYHGYDAYEWKMRSLMPAPDFNFNFYNKTVSKLEKGDIENYDVFIFPKSIGDINDSGPNVIQHLANIISATSKNKIYFLNSYVSKSKQNVSHVSFFKKIHDALISQGFTTLDKYDDTFYRGEQGQGLKGIDYDFTYNDKYFIKCNNKEKSCVDCNVIKFPILKNNFMSYQILEYTR
ncbi:hypothetical protein O1C43_002845 [Vibrio cholerae]|uniref:hypothetical protein n=1 Tax=Vibrio cholerae TaxID=666 RepID=UPI002AB49A57|nr:hypothetical protein [Vibrio cholerae]EKF9603035.1 hypothetical protein [Vibrio cholerae]MDY7587727.1 hypothetical protein [Vibrio cholerae]